MRIESHENLAVWSIRHEQFGIERFTRPDHPQQDHCHIHHHLCRDRFEPSEAYQRITHTQRPEHIAPRPQQDHPITEPAHSPEVFLAPLPLTDIVTIPADIAPASEPGALQGYLHGQAVPVNGNLLDVVA